MALILEYERLSLATWDPFGTSHGTRQRFENVLVHIRDGELEGLGEAAPSAYSGESVRSVTAALERLRAVTPFDAAGLEREPTILNDALGRDRAAHAAVDMALLDLEAKRRGLSLGASLGLAARPLPLTSYTIGIDEPEAMLRKAQRSGDFPLLKVKLGFPGDVEVVERIRDETGKRLIVDVNGGWSLSQARDNIGRLAACGVELLEQPVAPTDLDGLRALRELHLLPIVADEGVAGPQDVRRLRDCVDGINVKLSKCGGVRPALRTIREARALGMKVLLGCRIESSLACTAAAHLAVLADWADLDGAALISNDPFEGMAIAQGRILLPTRPGIGVVPRSTDPQAVSARSGAESGLQRVIARYRTLEHRISAAYLRWVPQPMLAHVDPPLRDAMATMRRALATPLYVKQELASWTGPCGDAASTIVIWGKRRDVRRLFDIFFDGKPQATGHGDRTLRTALRTPTMLPDAADLFVAETTPALAPLFRRRGFMIVPVAVRFTGVPTALLAAQERPSKSLQSDLALIRRARHRIEIWPYTQARSVTFYERYLIPHARGRFAERAELPDFDWSDRLFASGFALAILPPDGDEPDVIGIARARGDVLSLARLGAKDGDPAVLRTGGIAALYQSTIRFAHERGFRLIDMGRGRPWRTDGVVRYKLKWGFSPMVEAAETLEYAVRIIRADSCSARRLVDRQVAVRAGRRLRFLSSEGTIESQATMMPRRAT